MESIKLELTSLTQELAPLTISKAVATGSEQMPPNESQLVLRLG